MKTRGQFARFLLPELGAYNTTHNMRALMAWFQAEGDAGKFNPLNTTLSMPNDSVFNSVGVRNYATFGDGIVATARTLNYGADNGLYGYGRIRASLRRNEPAWKTLRAVEKSEWGTGGLALACLPLAAAASGRLQHHPLSQ